MSTAAETAKIADAVPSRKPRCSAHRGSAASLAAPHGARQGDGEAQGRRGRAGSPGGLPAA